MIEMERNSAVEPLALAEFFARCGWEEPEAAVKLEWALAASHEWVVCRLDGELIGFGRSCRLSPVRRVVFDLVVDPRFKGTGLRAEIARLLMENARGFEEVTVFSENRVAPPGYLPVTSEGTAPGSVPVFPPKVYLGKRSNSQGVEE